MKKTILLFILMLLPIMSWADDSGECGNGVTYKYVESTHILTISKTGVGTGDMSNYSDMHPAPWINYGADIIKVIIEAGVNSIGSWAFECCKSLTAVTISEGVTTIGDDAFLFCNNLLAITIPSSVTSIGNDAFSGCSSLLSVIIPAGVTSVGVGAFSDCNSLASVTIPKGVTSISNYAFSGCYSLASVTIPEGVTSIGNDAFSGCSSLASVTIPEGVTSIGNNAFKNCSMPSLTIPKEVTSIGNDAFYGCSSLAVVKISDIKAWCNIRFGNDCSNPLLYAHHIYLNDDEILSLTIPTGVTSISKGAFSNCSSLTTVIIPEGVISVGDGAFMSCGGLTSVTIPNSVTSIGIQAFANCYNLTSVTLPANMTSIMEGTFYNCSSLMSTTIPVGVTSIGEAAFNNCSDLTDLTIPNSVTSIGKYAFAWCGSLTSLSIPNSVTYIGENAFYECDGMISLFLPDNLTIIKKETFQNCSSLTSLTIPASVEYIYQNAFNGCSALEEINAQPTTPPFIYNNTFSDYTVPLNVPTGARNAYLEADNWKNFTTINDGNVYYTLSITSDSHGSVTYGESEVTGKTETFNVLEGANVTLGFTPVTGYALTGLTIGGVDKLSDVSGGKLTINNVSANTTVVATFTYSGSTSTITISSAGQGTYCSDKDLDFSDASGIKAYVASGFNPDNGNILLMRVKEVPAGTGLLVKGSAGNYTIPVKETHFYYLNMLKPVFAATTVAAEEDGYANYVLANGPDGLMFYRSSGASLSANRAYLQIPTSLLGSHSSARVLNYFFDDEDGTTGINEVNNDLGRAVFYNLNGQRIDSPRKGIYLRNGKKMIIK